MEKYLPIGTICSVKGRNKLVMITGYYDVEFNGNLRFSDYSGVSYPEGTLKPGSRIGFNHSDIEEVVYSGYVDNDFSKFQELLKGMNEKENTGVVSSKLYSKIEFDENGVVVLAEPITENESPKKNPIDSGFEFDENGVVIGVKNESVNNPFHTEYQEDVKPQLGKIQFDENGVVIGVNDNQTAPKKEPNKLSAIKFDENGIVVG